MRMMDIKLINSQALPISKVSITFIKVDQRPISPANILAVRKNGKKTVIGIKIAVKYSNFLGTFKVVLLSSGTIYKIKEPMRSEKQMYNINSVKETKSISIHLLLFAFISK